MHHTGLGTNTLMHKHQAITCTCCKLPHNCTACINIVLTERQVPSPRAMRSSDPHLGLHIPTPTSFVTREVGVRVRGPTSVGHRMPWIWVRALVTPKPVHLSRQAICWSLDLCTDLRRKANRSSICGASPPSLPPLIQLPPISCTATSCSALSSSASGSCTSSLSTCLPWRESCPAGQKLYSLPHICTIHLFCT